jgi:hypothetical protein
MTTHMHGSVLGQHLFFFSLYSNKGKGDKNATPNSNRTKKRPGNWKSENICF